MFNLQFFMPMIPPTVTFQDKELAVIKGRPVIHDSPHLAAALSNRKRTRMLVNVSIAATKKKTQPPADGQELRSVR